MSARASSNLNPSASSQELLFKDNVAIVVFGASGDLAKKKTLPALFGLFTQNELPPTTRIFGYARSDLSNDQFHDKFVPNLEKKKHSERIKDFLKITQYTKGSYTDGTYFQNLEKQIQEFESENNVQTPQRIYYFALPPSTFFDVASNLKKFNYTGKVRLVIEKPFGHDLKSATELINQLKPLFSEDEVFRIDHYLGKELVKNLLVLRFGNEIFNASWSQSSIKSIQIVFKEAFGTEGRGGYFDNIGIIRDVMQNHLLQVLTLLTMERPINFDAESIRDEKVKVLKAFQPLDFNDILVGQYVSSDDGKYPSYIDDETVTNKNSKQVTFAAIGMKINNERWENVPIVMRAGKALNESKVEIRIQFKQVAKGMFNNIHKNELVIRIQPDPAIYLKINSKIPGLSNKTSIIDLNLAYDRRYHDFWVPEAYESLIRDVLHGEHTNFVRDDELKVSWALFTPLLNYIEGSHKVDNEKTEEEKEGPKLIKYKYGVRFVPDLLEFLTKHGYEVQSKDAYQWPVTTPDILQKI